MNEDQLVILRRICERGQSYALKRNDSRYVDIFQHLLNEISLLVTENNHKVKCSICGTTENVRWVGGYQPFLCDSDDCIPF